MMEVVAWRLLLRLILVMVLRARRQLFFRRRRRGLSENMIDRVRIVRRGSIVPLDLSLIAARKILPIFRLRRRRIATSLVELMVIVVVVVIATPLVLLLFFRLVMQMALMRVVGMALRRMAPAMLILIFFV